MYKICIYMYICVNVFICLYVYLYIPYSMHICIYVYMHKVYIYLRYICIKCKVYMYLEVCRSFIP